MEIGVCIKLPPCPMWGEHRKEKKPNRMREMKGAQEKETAKVRKSTEGKERTK